MSVSMSLTYEGEFRARLHHGPSGTQIMTDAPIDNGGKGSAFSPTDLVAAALMSCAVTTMALVAKREGLPFTTGSATVTKEMLSDPRRIGRLALDIELPASLSAEHRARLEAIARGCPVARSVGSDVRIEWRFRYETSS
ncbi:MAG: OsmC family protein [Deltaproteobacteria bacterium]|nr:OsmC family protein [Deltaproteobacteria bacterium]